MVVTTDSSYHHNLTIHNYMTVFYCHICYEYNMHEDVSASAIGRVWQAGMSDERLSDVSVLSDMIEIRNGLKTCNIF